MEPKRIYLYTKKGMEEILAFLDVYEVFKTSPLTEHLMMLTVIGSYEPDTLEKIRDFVMVELYTDFVAFVCPNTLKLKTEDIEAMLTSLNKGIYTIDTLIIELVMNQRTPYIQKFRNYYYTYFSPETVETILGFIEQDLNASKTAKALYMHRNTLNYRLDNFIKKTEIDVRTFKGALAIYLLFKR